MTPEEARQHLLRRTGPDQCNILKEDVSAIFAIINALDAAELAVADHEVRETHRQEADMRAIERWQAGDPTRKRIWPDHSDLCTWLFQKWEAAESDTRRINRLEAEMPLTLMRYRESECIGDVVEAGEGVGKTLRLAIDNLDAAAKGAK